MSPTALERGRRVLRQRGVDAAVLGAADEARAQVELRWLRHRGAQTFVVDGIEHTQLVHLHNRTWRNERAVEVPLALAFLARCEGPSGPTERETQGPSGPTERETCPVLELGNVLANYGRVGHVVIDKYEQGPGIVNVDVVDYHPAERFEAIVAVSTLEHVGWDEEPRDPAKIPRAVQRLRYLLRPTGRLLVTCPLSHNPHLDALVTNDALRPDRQTWLVRDGKGQWTQAERAAASAHARMGRYGATAVWVAELRP